MIRVAPRTRLNRTRTLHTANMWSTNIAVLARTYDIIVPDLIGHGPCRDPLRKSEGPLTLDYKPVHGCDSKTYPDHC